MKHFEWSWKSPSNKQVFAQGWQPENKKNTKGVILIIHGLGEHSGRYEHVAEAATAKGLAVLSCDRVGHGKSAGKRGHIAKYEQCLDDVKKLHTEATRRYGELPVFLYGHSMGGGIVLNYILRKKKTGLKGVIATGSALKLAFEPSGFMLTLGKIMRNIYPSFTQGNGLDVKQLSRNQETVDNYVNDPLVHKKVSSIVGLGLLDYGKYALENVSKVPKNLPLLLMHGSADGITAAVGTEEFAEKAKTINQDVTLKIWDGFYHEIHNEPEQDEVIDYTLQWVLKRLK